MKARPVRDSLRGEGEVNPLGAADVQHNEPTELKTLISDIVRRSAVAPRLKGIMLESDEASDENGFFRVTIALDGLDAIDDEDMVALTASIEGAINDLDARFPSIRFAEAA